MEEGLKVFVTRELYPFTAGGIGRVISNILTAMDPAQMQPTAILYLAEGLDPARFAARYPNVLLINAPPNTYVESDGPTRYPPAEAYRDTRWHAESARAMQALKRLERDRGKIAYIEFTDWGGTSFATNQEKRLGLAFHQTIVAVRLHSTDSLLAAYEKRRTDLSALALYDLERKALADCDLIVAQLENIAEINRRFFNFDPAQWQAKLCIHAPPVLLDAGPAATTSIVPDAYTPIVFSSKIQHFKRPETFIRGCCGLLRARADYRGSVIVLAFSTDKDYLAQIKQLIPADLASRFLFIGQASSTERHSIISRSICVFPSIYESFCLAPYEASRSGALCVLNQRNPAFAESTPWRSGENCVKFDGSADDLTQTLAALFEASSSYAPVEAPRHAAPWLQSPPPPSLSSGTSFAPAALALPLVSVLIPHYNLGEYLHHTLDSVLASDYPNIEIVIVDDASTQEVSCAVIDRLARAAHAGLQVVRRTCNAGAGRARNIALDLAKGEYVLPLDADDLIHPAFIALAARALDRNPEYDFVVPQAAYFTDADASVVTQRNAHQCLVFLGDAHASGLHQNYFSTTTLLARKTALNALRYDEALDAYEDWGLYQRAVMQGRRFLVTNHLQFFFRYRPDSMMHSQAARAQIAQHHHSLIRSQQFTLGKVRLPLYAILPMGGLAHHAEIKVDAPKSRRALTAHEEHEVVLAALAVAHVLHARAPWLLTWARRLGYFAWRTAKRLRTKWG